MTNLTATVDDLPAGVAQVLADPPAGRRIVVEASGYAWHTGEWGDPADPPVVMVHGVTSNLETFWRVAPCVSAVGRRVVAVDLPGHGLTNGWRGRHRHAETAADLAGLIRAMDLDRPDLAVVGHSWGAMTVASLPAAGVRPQRLILLDPPALTREEIVPLTEDPTEQRYEDVDAAIDAIRDAGVTWSDRDIRAKAEALTQIDEAAVRAIYLENDYDAGLAALSDPAAERISTWIIRGDPTSGGLIADEHASALIERVGADQFVTIPGAGHSPQRTHPEATVLAIFRALE